MIGIFDSGSGGLTVLRAIRDVLPSCDVVYFGDIKNAPYGSKSHEELSLLTVQAMQLLQERGADKIVSACNSVSASLAMSLFDAFDLAPSQMIEMVGPTVAQFRGSDARIVLCATPATVRSGIYQNAFRMIAKDIAVVPVPELAGAIERGASEEEMRGIIRTAFADVELADYDVLILGCTHYPLVLHLFKELVPPTLAVFDPALSVAARVEKRFWPQEVADGKTAFLLSRDSAQFHALAEKLFPGTAYTIEVLE